MCCELLLTHGSGISLLQFIGKDRITQSSQKFSWDNTVFRKKVLCDLPWVSRVKPSSSVRIEIHEHSNKCYICLIRAFASICYPDCL